MITELFNQFLASVAESLYAISAPSARTTPHFCSLIKNLLRTFFKFTSSFVVQLLLFGHGGCAVLRLPSCWHLRRRCIAHLLPVRGVVGLLRRATLVKSLSVVILLGGIQKVTWPCPLSCVLT